MLEPQTLPSPFFRWVRRTAEKTAHLQRLKISRRLTICFVLIIALMLAGNCVLLWQFHLVRVQEEHLSGVDQQLIAVLRVHSGLMAFYEKLDSLSHTQDADRLQREAEPLRDGLLQDTRRIRDSLSMATREANLDSTLLPTLETIESALPSQLEVIAALGRSGDWTAVKLRLENEVRPLESLTSALVQSADGEVAHAQAAALENIRSVQRLILLFVPLSALFTLFFAGFLGFAITRSIAEPLNRLMEGSKALARGEFEHQVAIRGEDELAHLGLVFNDTARQLRDLYETLRTREEKLRQDEQELRTIINAISGAITVLGTNGRTLYVNQTVLDFTGLSMEEVLAPDYSTRAFHPEDVERVRDERLKGLSRGVPFENELRARRKDGQYRWFLVSYSPLRDEQGRIIRWYATGTDIDDRKRAEDRTRDENLALREEIDRSSMFDEILGSSDKLVKVLSQVSRVAKTDSTVLILGETGTGKELVARAIHKQSHRAAQAFVRINCAAIPLSLISSELFGHEKGAFTGAFQRRLGRFEAANGGTILLDEIGELPAETQIALLRVLQEREFERVGSNKAIPVDVRILAATNRDLKEAVSQGTFREDLFYRLNVFPIYLPPLRERPEDIALLVEYFLERFAKKVEKQFRNIRKATLDQFRAYGWPGNVRELQNVMERAVLLCDGETFYVDESWLKKEMRSEAPQASVSLDGLKRPEASREREMIEAALAQSAGRISGTSGAAVKLGIPRQTLEWKIARLGIDRTRYQNT
jgi:formate hydrogenlyase transcriptional activator